MCDWAPGMHHATSGSRRGRSTRDLRAPDRVTGGEAPAPRGATVTLRGARGRLRDALPAASPAPRNFIQGTHLGQPRVSIGHVDLSEPGVPE